MTPQAPTGVVTVCMMPVNVAPNGVIEGAVFDSPPPVSVPVASVLAACAATGATANADMTAKPADDPCDPRVADET